MKFNLGKKALMLFAVTSVAMTVTACSNDATTTEEPANTVVEDVVPEEETTEEEVSTEPQVLVDEVNNFSITVPAEFVVSGDEPEEGTEPVEPTGMMLRISNPDGGSLHVFTLANAEAGIVEENRATTLAILESREAGEVTEEAPQVVTIDGVEFDLIVTNHTNEKRTRVNKYFSHFDAENNVFYNFMIAVDPENVESLATFEGILENNVSINR